MSGDGICNVKVIFAPSPSWYSTDREIKVQVAKTEMSVGENPSLLSSSSNVGCEQNGQGREPKRDVRKTTVRRRFLVYMYFLLPI